MRLFEISLAAFGLLLYGAACTSPEKAALRQSVALADDTLADRLKACRLLEERPFAANDYQQYYENQPILAQTNYFSIENIGPALRFRIRELVGSFQQEGSAKKEYYFGEWEIDLQDTSSLFPFYDLQIAEEGDTAYYTHRVRGALRLVGRAETTYQSQLLDLYQVYVYDPEDGIPENPKALLSRRPMQVLYWSPLVGSVRTYFGEGNYFDLQSSTLIKDPELLPALKSLIQP